MLPLLNSCTCKLSSSSGVKIVNLNLIIIMCYIKIACPIKDRMKIVSPRVKVGESKILMSFVMVSPFVLCQFLFRCAVPIFAKY
jgi:hypothetical protein